MLRRRHNRIGRTGLEAIAASEHLRGLHYLALNGNPVEDPTPQLGGVDWTGFVADVDYPALGKELRDRYGPLPWLEWEPTRETEAIPDRDVR